MKNEDFKIINERWDKYIKEDPQLLNEDLLDFINRLLTSGDLAYYKAVWDLVYWILSTTGWFAAKSAAGYLALRTVYRAIRKWNSNLMPLVICK